MHFKNRQSTSYSRGSRGSAIVEFAPALIVVLLFFTVPLINLLGLATAATTVMLVTNAAVATACTQQSYTDALSSVNSSELSFLNSGFAKFANISAGGGYQYDGVDLYTQVSTYGSSAAPVLLGPNTPVPPPIDVTNHLYEYAAMGHFKIAPLIAMSGVPLLNTIPGLGLPWDMNFRSVKLVEHPQGLPFATVGNGGSYNGQLSTFSRAPITTNNPNNVNATPNKPFWRSSDIYQQIASAGETVLSTTVYKVYAVPGWQATGVTAVAGQHLWVDTNAAGQWTTQGFFTFDASGTGFGGIGWSAGGLIAEDPWGALLGYAGTTPPNAASTFAIQGTPDPNSFVAGDTLLNYSLPAGPLSFIDNTTKGTGDLNTGFQVVRVIVAQ